MLCFPHAPVMKAFSLELLTSADAVGSKVCAFKFGFWNVSEHHYFKLYTNGVLSGKARVGCHVGGIVLGRSNV